MVFYHLVIFADGTHRFSSWQGVSCFLLLTTKKARVRNTSKVYIPMFERFIGIPLFDGGVLMYLCLRSVLI